MEWAGPVRDGAEVVHDYIVLALRLDRLQPGAVDTYLGDPALKRRVDAEPAVPAVDLVRSADRLIAALPDTGLPVRRRRFLAAQLRAVACSARRSAGRSVPFVEQVRDCFDVHPVPGDQDAYAAVHRELHALLPGHGSLAARMAAYRRSDEVPPDRLGPAVRAGYAAQRDRTRAAFDLPADEAVDYRVVDDAAWSALNRYLGSHRSGVWLNAAARLRAAQLVPLVAHESYPGHHTDNCRKDAGLVTRHGEREHTVLLVDSPQSLLAEGVADLALPVLVGAGWGRWAEGVLAETGIRTDGELAERVDRAMAGLLRVRLDAALLLHDRGASADEVTSHLRRWLLVDDVRAGQMLRFLTHSRWRAYTTTYVEGFLLLRDWLHRPGPDRADPVARFGRLLDEPLTPSALREEITDAAPGRCCVRTAGSRTCTAGDQADDGWWPVRGER